MRLLTLILALTLADRVAAEDWPGRFDALWTTSGQSVGPLDFDARKSVTFGETWVCSNCGFYDHTFELRVTARDPGYTGMTDADILDRAEWRCAPPGCSVSETTVAGHPAAYVRAVFAPWTVSHRWTIPLATEVLTVMVEEDRNPNVLTTDLLPRDAEIVAAIETTLLPTLLGQAP